MGLLIGGIGMSFLFADTTQAASITHITSPLNIVANSTGDFDNAEPEAAEGDNETATTCELGGIGWIICPLATEASKIVDSAYGFVARLLTVAPLLTTGQSGNIYAAWQIMRNFANVAFVIGFMLIIFSQLTSFGLNNYGVKKMLPRLIVAAILVNVSYWICAIAVDISNILGASLNGLMQGLTLEGGGNAALPTGANSAQIGGAETGGWVGVTALVLGSATLLYVGLSALLPALLAVILAILTVVLVLTVRQALIVLLVVISPLAFVAYLLPNTESLFKKWMALFKTMLLMYPIIALLFGASAVASSILLSTPAESTDPESNDALYQIAMQIMGAAIAIIPLALTPIIMKTAGSVLGRVGAFVNNPNKGPFDRMRKGAEGIRKRQEGRRAIRELNGERTMGLGKYRRAANRSRIETGIESERKRAEADYLSQKTVSSEAFRNKAAGGLNVGGPTASQEAMQRALNSAIDVQAQIEVSEVKAATAQIEHAGIPNDMVQALAQGHRTYQHQKEDGSFEERQVTLGDSMAMRKAAIQQQVGSGQADKISALVDQYGGIKGEESKTLANALQSSSGRPGWIGAGAIEAIRQGEAKGDPVKNLTTTQAQMESAIKSGAYSAEKMATADADELQMLASYVHSTNPSATPEQKAFRDALVKNAQTALKDPILSTKLGKRGSNIEAIAYKQAGVAPGPARTTGPAPQNPPQPQQPGVLNIPHGANPGNSRTPPANLGGNPGANGLIIPGNNQNDNQS